MSKLYFLFSIGIILFDGSVSSNLSFRKRVSRASNSKLAEDLRSTTEWPGRWFPEKVTERPYPVFRPVVHTSHENSLVNMINMMNPSCDNGKSNLTVDLPEYPPDYCDLPKGLFWPDPNVDGVIRKELVPKFYRAYHTCMNETITYKSDPPTFGSHRLVWARWGEYSYIPPQRWLHNAEHGGIILLYNPCTHPAILDRLKTIVKSCLYRHIITPYPLPQKYPMALIAWGYSFMMPNVDDEQVINFIKNHALKGPENLSKDGGYDLYLTNPANIVSDLNDSDLCSKKYF